MNCGRLFGMVTMVEMHACGGMSRFVVHLIRFSCGWINIGVRGD